MKYISVISFLLLSVAALYAQNKKMIDSLESNLSNYKHVEKASALYELVYYYLRVDNEKAKKYFLECRAQLSTTPDEAVKAYCFMAQGVYYNRNGLLDSAVILLEEGKRHALAGNENRALIRIYASLAHTYISSGKPKEGLDHLFQALRVVNDHPDKEMEFKLRTNIPWAYLELKQYRSCIEYGLQNLRLMEGTALEWIALYTYNNVAVCYGGSGMIDSAKFYIHKGIAAAQQSNDNQSLANGYFILGTIYANAGKYSEAIEQYLKARPYREKVGNPFFVVSDLYTLSSLYNKSGEFKKGIEAGMEALKLAEKHKLTLKLESTYQSLAQNYEGLGDFRNASKFYRLLGVAKDSIYKHASTEAIAEMQTRYETEKKEKQLAIQKAELLQQDAAIRQTYYVISGLIFSIVLLVVIFILLRVRMKKKQEILQKEREIYVREAQIIASIHSQETERKRFAQDLHDGMGQLISALRLALFDINQNSTTEDRLTVVSRSEKILNEMNREIRGIAFNLMPQTLVQHGLIPALKEMGDRLNSSGKLIVGVRSFEMPSRLSEVEEISLYRVIQEWVNNIIKYAGATFVQVQLIGHENEINVTVEDDGAGFDISELEKGNGHGWKNIRSRLNLIKASIEIDSQPGLAGTTVIIRLPLTEEKVVSIPDKNVTDKIQPATVAPNTH